MLFGAMTMGSVSAQGAPTVIRIGTQNTDLILQVADNGRLYQSYFGEHLLHDADINQFSWNVLSSSDGSMSDRGWEVYSCNGNEDYFEPALSVIHNDGNRTTYLYYQNHKQTKVAGGVQTDIVLSDNQYPIEVTLHYIAYEQEDVIKCWSEIRHQEKKPVTLLTYATTMLYFNNPAYYLTEFSSDWANEAKMSSQRLQFGKKVIDTKLGSRAAMFTHPFFEVGLDHPVSEKEGNVLLGTVGWTGNFRFTFEVDNAGNLRVIPGINPYSSDYKLQPNEVFETAEFIFTLSNQGASHGSRNLHDWARRYQVKDGMGDRLSLLNNWENTGFDFNQQTLASFMHEAKNLGVDLFLLDDGWFGNGETARNDDHAGLGDWDVNRAKLPQGIPALVDAAKEAGVKFGIWIEPEMVNPKSNLANAHPDWVVRSPGREIYTGRNQWLLDLSNPAVQDFVYGVFDRTMQLSDKIDYIKWDCNRVVNSFGSDWQTDQDRFFVEYVQGYYKVLRRIREKYPNVMIQCCSSGGSRVDYGQLAFHNEVWASDNTDAVCRARIQYGTSLIYPASIMGCHVSAVPNHQSGMTTPLKFRFDMACAGRLGMELQPKTLSESERALADLCIQSYKQYRDLVFFGDLYRLVAPEEGRYALMYVSQDKRRAVVYGFNLSYESREIFRTLRLDGLNPDLRYKVNELNVDKSCWWGNGDTFTGDFLMNGGFNPRLEKPYSSAIFYLEAE